MLIVGIAGQTGAGKSMLAKMLSKLGFGENIEVDEVGHTLLKSPKISALLCQAFGQDILINGQIDRKALGKKAFASKEATARLNSIMHAEMTKIVKDKIEKAKADNAPAIIINAALLYTMKLNLLCELIVYVASNPEIRLKRLTEKRGWAEERAKIRLFAQDKVINEPKTIVIYNNGTQEELYKEAEKLKEKFLPPKQPQEQRQ